MKNCGKILLKTAPALTTIREKDISRTDLGAGSLCSLQPRPIMRYTGQWRPAAPTTPACSPPVPRIRA